MERRKGRVTWRAPRAQATSFLSFLSSPALLLFLLILPFFSLSCLSFNTPPPPLPYSCPRLPSTTLLWVGKPKAETGAKHDGMLEPSEPWAGAADKRPLCQLRKWLSQDPPSPPYTGAAGLEAPGLPGLHVLPHHAVSYLLTIYFKWKLNSNLSYGVVCSLF